MTKRLKSLWAQSILAYANGQATLIEVRFWENRYRASLANQHLTHRNYYTFTKV